MDLVYVFRVLYKRKFLLIASAFIAAAAAFFFTLNERKYFRSTGQLSTGYTINDAIKVAGEKQTRSPVYTQVNKDSAIRIFSEKLETMSLLTSYRPEEKKMIEFLKLYGYDYKSIQRVLNVYRLQRTDYIQIDYISENPELSAFAVNTVYNEFIRYYKYVRSTKSIEAIDTLRSLMEKKRQEL